MLHHLRLLLPLIVLALPISPHDARASVPRATSQPLGSPTEAAASHILCVSLQGGATSAPCTNATAYTTVQGAVDQASSGDEIRIAAGVYSGSAGTEYVVSIWSKSLTLRGGYSVDDWTAPAPSATTILDGLGQRPVLQLFSASAVLERLTISHGRSNNNGGGIDANMNLLQSLTLIDSIVSDNTANGGAGIFAVGGTTHLVRTQVVGNTAGGDGGGFYGRDLTIVDGLFANNRAERHAGGIAALHIAGERTRIVNNVALSGNGGGIFFNPSNLHGTLALTSTQIISNTAGERAGGLYLGVEQAQLVEVLIADNRAAVTDGLVLDPATLDAAQLSLTNVTLASAVPSPHAAIQIGVLSTAKPVALSLVNTTVTSHTLGIMRPGNSTLTGNYNAFFGNEVDQQVSGVDTPLSFANLLTADPRFAAPLDQNFHLQSGSPLVNAGDPGRNYSGQFDIDGEAVPFGGRAEIGADEATADLPTATADTLTVVEDSGPTVVDVLANDSSASNSGETLSVTTVTQPDNGMVTLTSGTVRFQPSANFAGTTSFIYTVADEIGGTATGTVAVTVTNVNDLPTASFSGTSILNEGSTASVSFSDTRDRDPADSAAGLHYSYDFDNDGTFDLGDGTYHGSNASTTAAIPAPLLADGPAMLTVRAWVIDQNNTHSEYTTQVIVVNVAPTVALGGPYQSDATHPITLTASATDPSYDTLSYAWDLDDDGAFDDASGQSARFQATRSGSYIVRVQVTDKDGAQAVAAATVQIAAYRVFLPMTQGGVGRAEQA